MALYLGSKKVCPTKKADRVVLNGSYQELASRFVVFKNTSFSVGGTTAASAGIELDLSSVTFPDTIRNAAFILKIRPINQQGTANAIITNFEPTSVTSRIKLQLNGNLRTFAIYDRLTNSGSATTDNYAVTYSDLGANAYWVALVFDGTKNYGYIIQDTNDNNPIEGSFCPIPLTDNGWHKTNGFVSDGQNNSFLKNGYKYFIGTGWDYNIEGTVQIFSGIIHLDSVELRINDERVWMLIS